MKTTFIRVAKLNLILDYANIYHEKQTLTSFFILSIHKINIVSLYILIAQSLPQPRLTFLNRFKHTSIDKTPPHTT